jgi:RNA polymerase primary sigma factor
MEDLISEGNLGLLRAAEGFDPGMQTRFSTYAIYWIKQSIKRAIVNTARTVRVPAYAAEQIIKWRRAVAVLHEELGRAPTEAEVAGNLGLSAKRLKIIRKALRIYNSSSHCPFDEGLSQVEATAAGPDAAITGEEEMRQVLGLLGELGERHAAVLRLRFGLSGEAPKTLKEIGDHLGLTRERVRQLEVEALGQLRERMEAA